MLEEQFTKAAKQEESIRDNFKQLGFKAMYATKIETVIPVDHRLTLEIPAYIPPGEAEIIVLSKVQPPQEAEHKGDGRVILEFLRNNPLPSECRRKSEEMEAHIQAERNAWD